MESASPPRKNADEFARFYSRLSERSMAPLWEVIRNVITAEPVTPVKPAHWRANNRYTAQPSLEGAQVARSKL